MVAKKTSKNSDILFGIGKTKKMRLNGHDVTVIVPKRLISLKEGEKRLKEILSS